jgi:hypothetical protein
MLNFKKLYSKFVGLVVIFLLLIAANSFVGLFNKSDNPEVQNSEEVMEQEDSSFVEDTEDAPDPTIFSESSESATKIFPITYEAQSDDQNAFELLKDVAEVEYTEYDFGTFVESINGVKGDDKNFWAFYLNDEKSQTGADQTILQKGDKVEWRYEKIQ